MQQSLFGTRLRRFVRLAIFLRLFTTVQKESVRSVNIQLLCGKRLDSTVITALTKNPFGMLH
jgi:hypothetical protein